MRLLTLTLFVLLAAGCAVGPDYRRPQMSLPAEFSNANTNLSSSSLNYSQTWWRGFNDPLLERLITLASTNNHDVRIAQARLRETRALWTEARFDFAPTIRNENRWEKYRLSEDAAGTRSRSSELFRAGFDATWELDIWGRVRRNVEAARATVESVEATREDVLITVQAEVAANYIELRGIQALLGIAARNATNQAQILQLAEVLRDGGQGTQLDVARARSLLNSTLASIPPLQAAADRAAHRIAVLCGQSPTSMNSDLSKAQAIPVSPLNFDFGDPTQLIRRRPDIRAVERSLAAATARIGFEVADLFPRVTFTGTIGLQANSGGELGSAASQAWGFGPHISWAAFDIGRVRQRIKAAGARAEVALAVYEHTVLLALEETENSLVALRRARERMAYLLESERAAGEATELARQRYRDGISDFLSVLDAERTLLSLQEQVTVTESSTATSLVSVFKSFAGSLAD